VGPLRTNNDAFWQELGQITHEKQDKTTKPRQPEYSLHTFELNDALLEDKVKRITAQQIARSQNELRV